MWLFGIAIVLLSAGVVMVYSASAIVAAERFHDPFFFLKKQLFWALLGAGCTVDGDPRSTTAAWRSSWCRRWSWPSCCWSWCSCSPFGQSINGTRRWLRLGPVSFQPVELAKLALVHLPGRVPRAEGRAARRVLARARAAARWWRDCWPGWSCAQPDLGNCLTLLALTFGLLFLAGRRARHLGLHPGRRAAGGGGLGHRPYRLRRIMAFLDPWQDPRGSGFQIIQSYLAIGGGGLFGRGIGESRQKLFYLPEAHTDFIFAIIGEELGFVGAVAVVALFAVLIWRGLRVGLRAPEPFGGYLALGITVLLATQTIVNLGVVTGLLPTKGLPLPFISSGGSALVVTMASTGVLLNISQHTHV